MTVSLDTRQAIREMDAGGVSRTQIARSLGLSRNTVTKYADLEDLSPAAPIIPTRPHPAIDGYAGWIDKMLSEDSGRPRKQRHTSRRIFDRLRDERGYRGSYATVCRYVSEWRRSRTTSPRDGYLELEWSPGTAQVDFGGFRCVLSGASTDMRLLVVTLPHSNSRYCVAMRDEHAECFCAGLASVFGWIGRVPSTLVLDNATEAGRMVHGKVTESTLFSQLRAHYRCASRYCNPYSGNEKGSVENAVGFLRRNLLVPEPSVGTVDQLNDLLRAGCDKINASSRNRQGRPTTEALGEDLSGMLALPGVPFDAVRWIHARADKRGYVVVCGNGYCAGPAWHDREILVGMRADSVEMRADRGGHVATLRRAWGGGEVVRNPLSLVPALVARPRAFGESTIRRDMPQGLVDALDRCAKAERRQVLRAISRASVAVGFDIACQAADSVFSAGRVPDDASCDMLARRIAAGMGDAGGPDLSVYDGFLGEA